MLVIAAPKSDDDEHNFRQEHFEDLYPHISSFSLATYGFSNAERPGANAPLNWIRQVVEDICPDTLPSYDEKRKKILIGLNMHGYDYSTRGDASKIVGSRFLELLHHHAKPRLSYDERNGENFFELKYVLHE